METGDSPARVPTTTLSADRWARVRGVLESVLERPPEERAAFLRGISGADQELRAEVENLLRALGDSPSFLREPIPGEPPDPLIGSSVGPWRLLQRIGEGGTASVYAAARADHEFRKLVAVKIIKSGMDFEEILRRFRNERQILAALDHPNITRLLDGGSTASGLPYLVMEYVEGIPITRYADTHRLSVTERLHLFRTVCSAVEYAHQNLVIHRDLKPANILVNAQGVPKLLDFGIAKLLRPESTGVSIPFTRVRMMTPEYASPEQVRGDPITTATDIYSLGVVLYELLTGERPYRLKTAAQREMETAICESQPERPSTAARLAASFAEGTPKKLARRLRGDLDAIVLTALRKEPLRRYATVDRFGEDINRHLEGLPVSASKGDWSYRLRKFSARHKAGVAVTAAATLVLVGSTVVSAYFSRQAKRQQQLSLELASFMVGGFDAALQSGSTTARKASLGTVLNIVNQLSPDAAHDRYLRGLLFQAYLKLGDLQGNLYENNLGDSSDASLSYQRARELAKLPYEIAQSSLKLGDVAFQRGDHRSALANYQGAEQILERGLKDSNQPPVWPELTRSWYKIGFAELRLGRAPEALESYQRELEFARQWAGGIAPPLEARRELALAQEHVGYAFRATGNPTQARPHLEASLFLYGELLKSDPDNAVRRRDVAIGSLELAGLLRELGLRRQAENEYRTSLKITRALVAEDPGNEQYRRDETSALFPLSMLLSGAGQISESRRLTERALATLRPLAVKPNAAAYDIYQYCWDLLQTPFADLRRPLEALQLARKAVDLTRGTDPEFLNLQALAAEQNGDLTMAIASEQRALELYPPAQPRIPRTKAAEIAANLARFHTALTQANAAQHKQ